MAALARGSTHLEALTLATCSGNLWTCGTWTEAGLHAFRQARPGVQLNLIAC